MLTPMAWQYRCFDCRGIKSPEVQTYVWIPHIQVGLEWRFNINASISQQNLGLRQANKNLQYGLVEST